MAKKLNPEVLILIQPSLLYTGLLLAAVGFLGRRLSTRRGGKWLATATLAVALAVVPMLVLRWYAPLRLFAETDSSRRLAATILASPERDAPVVGFYYFRTSLPFYLRRPVGLLSVEWGETTSNYIVAHQAQARRSGESNPGKGVLLSLPEFRALSKSSLQPILVMTPNNRVEDLWGTVGHIDPLWNESDFSIWEVPPAKPGLPESAPSHVVTPFQP